MKTNKTNTQDVKRMKEKQTCLLEYFPESNQIDITILMRVHVLTECIAKLIADNVEDADVNTFMQDVTNKTQGYIDARN